MNKFPKAVRKELRLLAAAAYDRELSGALDKLEKQFARWRAGDISAHELNQLIHEHHNGKSRDLREWYQQSDNLVVCRAVADGILHESEMSEATQSAIAKMVENWKLL